LPGEDVSSIDNQGEHCDSNEDDPKHDDERLA
jgi:hypothetical protein